MTGPEHAAPGASALDGQARPRPRAWVAQHPVGAYFLGAYAFTWTLWLPAVLGVREGAIEVLFLLGVFGPLVSAVAVTRLRGDSARAWIRDVFHPRVSPRWYLLALMTPLAIMTLASAAMSLAGVELRFSLLADERLGALLPTLLFCLLLNGGPEEWGWRGFALPRLQEHSSPVRATIVLGGAWAFWHLPLLLISEEGLTHGLDPLGFALIMLWTIIGIAFGYAVIYTYLWNKTRSVAACMLLHAAFNTVNGVLLLVPAASQQGKTYVTISICVTATLLLVAASLVRLTNGRLGLDSAVNSNR